MFYLSRPYLSGEDQDEKARLRGGDEIETRGRWWYQPAQVCQRWRSIIFGSASYLGLFLVCTYGTPVADMLAHSPPLPLVVDYYTRDRDISTDDEEGTFLALKHRDRVLRVRLHRNLQKFIAAMDEEYPILEYLIITTPIEDDSTILTFPETFQAPHLRFLRLRGCVIPMGSRLLTTAVSLVTLSLFMAHPSTYFHPDALLQWISLIPQLETLTVDFVFPNRDVERQLTHTPITAPVTLPNLRHFVFRGVSTYLEALVHWITSPRLEKLLIELFSQLTFFVPRLLQLTNTAEDLRFVYANLCFLDKRVVVAIYPEMYIGDDVEMFAFAIGVFCWHLDWQVSSMVQISNSLNQVFSAVERLSLVHKVHGRSSEEHNEVDPAEWRRLLRPFSNVKILWVAEALVEGLSQCLQMKDGELPLELLPELQELTYYRSGPVGDEFMPFIDARRNAGRPIKVYRP